MNPASNHGGGFKITPAAQNDDGRLEHGVWKQVSFCQANKLIIESEQALEAQLDGELMLSNRFEVEILPEALKVVVGKPKR